MAKEAKKETVVGTMTVEAKNVTVYSSGDDRIRYRVNIGQSIDAIARDRDSGEYVEKQVDYIDFVPSVIIAQLLSQVEGLDIMFTKKKEQSLRAGTDSGFGAAELQVVLRGAKLTIERSKFEAGDEYTTQAGETFVHENAGYNTNITGVKVSERIQRNLDKLIDSMFDL